MKSQLVIVQFILVSCSLLATDATDYCDNLLHHCNQFKAHCSPTTITVRSCCDLINGLPFSKASSGVYQLSAKCDCQVRFTTTKSLAYCDMETSDGGWMVIQRNIKDKEVETFYKRWIDYVNGFGDLNGDKMWYGLRQLSCLTEIGQWELRVDIQFDNNTWSHLHYKKFKVGSGYRLTIGGFTGATTDDPFLAHNGMRFSTVDHDLDQHSGNCAHLHKSGWWFNNCTHINPNQQPPILYLNSKSFNVLKIEMKMRQVNCTTQ